MNTMTKIICALLVAIPLLAATKYSQAEDASATPGIDKRQENQEKRIQQGVNSGALNEREAARLEKGQRRVERMEERAKADGKVTPKERARIQHAENVQSKKIYREKHDAQRRK